MNKKNEIFFRTYFRLGGALKNPHKGGFSLVNLATGTGTRK